MYVPSLWTCWIDEKALEVLKAQVEHLTNGFVDLKVKEEAHQRAIGDMKEKYEVSQQEIEHLKNKGKASKWEIEAMKWEIEATKQKIRAQSKRVSISDILCTLYSSAFQSSPQYSHPCVLGHS